MDSQFLRVKEVQYCHCLEHRESTLSSGRSGGLQFYFSTVDGLTQSLKEALVGFSFCKNGSENKPPTSRDQRSIS